MTVESPTSLSHSIAALSSSVFDAIEGAFEAFVRGRGLGIFLAGTYLLTLAAIELGRRGVFPYALTVLGRSHFGAIAVAFGALLIVEILQLVMALARSIAVSMGKQVELLSLILLRKVFLAVGAFGEPVRWESVAKELPVIIADLAGALVIFILLGVYYRLQRHHPISMDALERRSFIAAKKAIALLLLAAFGVLGASAVWAALRGFPPVHALEVFYTILIFSDVLLVLLAFAFTSSYPVLLRDSGFAAATICIRLALIAPAFISALLGVGAAAFIVALTLTYNHFLRSSASAQTSTEVSAFHEM